MSYALRASGPEGLKPDYYSILLNKIVAILLCEKCRKSMNVREIGRR